MPFLSLRLLPQAGGNPFPLSLPPFHQTHLPSVLPLPRPCLQLWFCWKILCSDAVHPRVHPEQGQGGCARRVLGCLGTQGRGIRAHGSSWVCSQAGRWDTAGAGEKGCAPKLWPCAIKITLAGSRVREKKQLLLLLLAPTALSRQEDPEQRQEPRMNVQVLTVTMLLLVLLCSAPAPSGALGLQAGNLERQAGTGGPEEAPWLSGHGGDKLPGQGSESSHPLANAWKAMREVQPSSRSSSKALAKALLGTGEQLPPGKPWRLPLQPSRSRMARLSHHLRDYGKFNSDTVSTACPGTAGLVLGGAGCQGGSDSTGDSRSRC